MIQTEHTRIRSGWKDLIRRYPIHHFATLTFRIPVKPVQAIRAMETFVRDLERRAQNPVWWFGVQEAGPISERVHLHALLGGTENLSCRQIEAVWLPGRSQVAVYDDEAGDAIAYLTKGLSHGAEVVFPARINRKARRWALRRNGRQTATPHAESHAKLLE